MAIENCLLPRLLRDLISPTVDKASFGGLGMKHGEQLTRGVAEDPESRFVVGSRHG